MKNRSTSRSRDRDVVDPVGSITRVHKQVDRMSDALTDGPLDRRLGLTIILSFLAVSGAIGYGLFPSGISAGVFFGIAVVAAMLAIVAVHML